jgi:hypothetical protein
LKLRSINLWLGPFTIVKEPPGVISETSAWVILRSGAWMYGPYEQFWRCLYDMITGWKNDRNLVG